MYDEDAYVRNGKMAYMIEECAFFGKVILFIHFLCFTCHRDDSLRYLQIKFRLRTKTARIRSLFDKNKLI